MNNVARIAVTAMPISERLSNIPDLSFESAEEILTEIKGKGIDLVLLPQYSGCGTDEARKQKLFIDFALSENCYLVYNTIETDKEADSDIKKCVTVIIGRTGEVIGKYVKSHKIEGMDIEIALGEGSPVFDLDFGRVALMTGTDIFFPELSEIYSLKGAEILLCSMGVLPLREDSETSKLLRARAIEDYVYVAQSTYASYSKMYMINNYSVFGVKKDYTSPDMDKEFNAGGLGKHTGRACVYDLRGDIIASTGREKGAIVSEIDLKKKRNIKEYIYGLGDIVKHQNERGVFREILDNYREVKADYKVNKPVIGFIHMTYEDTIHSKNPNWYIKQVDMMNEAAKGCDIVICSEYSSSEYIPDGKVENQDEKIKLYSEVALNNKCYVAVNDCFDGMNTTYLFDRQGNIAYKYRKINTVRMMYDKIGPTGTEIPVLDLDFGKVGFTICADSYCQEISRILGIKGVDLIINQTQSWGYDPDCINEGVFRAWAIENCAFVATSSFSTSIVKLRTNIIDPTGETVFASDYNKEGVYKIAIDLEAARQKVCYVYDSDKVIKACDFKNRLMNARRPELYSYIHNLEDK